MSKKILLNPQIKSLIDLYENGKQIAFSDKTGIKPVSVNNLLYRNAKVSYENALKIQTAYPKVSLDYILGESNIMHADPEKKGIKKTLKVLNDDKSQMHEIQKRFLTIINQYAFHHNLTITKLAEMLAIPQNVMSQYKHFKRQISIEIVYRSSVVFGINPNYLLLGLDPVYLDSKVKRDDELQFLREKVRMYESKVQILEQNLDDLRDLIGKKGTKKGTKA